MQFKISDLYHYTREEPLQINIMEDSIQDILIDNMTMSFQNYMTICAYLSLLFISLVLLNRKRNSDKLYNSYKGPLLIGLMGEKGVGKTTMAKYMNKYHFHNLAFGDRLKETLAAMFGGELAGFHDPTVKERPIRELYGITRRQMMQFLGTVIRENMHNLHPKLADFWVMIVERQLKDYSRVVISDVRYHNEAEMIRRNDGILIQIVNSRIKNNDEHSSETEHKEIQPDIIIENNYETDDFHHTIDILMGMLSPFSELGFENFEYNVKKITATELLERNNIKYIKRNTKISLKPPTDSGEGLSSTIDEKNSGVSCTLPGAFCTSTHTWPDERGGVPEKEESDEEKDLTDAKSEGFCGKVSRKLSEEAKNEDALQEIDFDPDAGEENDEEDDEPINSGDPLSILDKVVSGEITLETEAAKLSIDKAPDIFGKPFPKRLSDVKITRDPTEPDLQSVLKETESFDKITSGVFTPAGSNNSWADDLEKLGNMGKDLL